MGKKKILVCDDDAELRQALAAILEPAYEVAQAGDGPQALAAIERDPPSLVLLDVSMPGMTGLETLAAYRRARPALRTIMLSSRSQLAVVRRALVLGARSYLTKPFDPEVVRAEVTLALESEPRAAPSGRPWRVAGQEAP